MHGDQNILHLAVEGISQHKHGCIYYEPMAAGASSPPAALGPCFATFSPAKLLPRNRPRGVYGGERGGAYLLLLSLGMAPAPPGQKRSAAGEQRQWDLGFSRDDHTGGEEDQAGDKSFRNDAWRQHSKFSCEGQTSRITYWS